MAITVNRNPVTVNTGNKANRDNSQYFNHVQFKGLCSNQNVDSIDPSTFADVENLYVDSDDTLASRPKLVTHDNFGFKSIEKMWIWDDVHLIQGFIETQVEEETVEQLILKDVINNETLDLSDETLEQIVRIENRVFIFLEDSVYVYEEVGNTYSFTEVTNSNLENYFYIPSTKTILNGVEAKGESKNEITDITKVVLIGNNPEIFDLDISDNKEVKFKIEGRVYSFNWQKGATYLTLGAPYITRNFEVIRMSENGTSLGLLNGVLYYSLNGTVWELLPDFLSSQEIVNFGLSKNGNYAWVAITEDPYNGNEGLYIVSLIATEYNPGDDPTETDPSIKKYPSWTQIISPSSKINQVYDVDMLDFDRYVAFFRLASTGANSNYLLVVAEGSTNQGEINQYSYSETIAWDINYINEARVFATDRIWAPSSNYLDYIFIKRNGKSLQISPFTYNNGVKNLAGNSPITNTTNVGNLFFNYGTGDNEDHLYDCSNLSTYGVIFTKTVDDLKKSYIPSYLDSSLLDENGNYIFSDNTICITIVRAVNYKNGNIARPELASEFTIILDGTKTIRPDDNNFGYFSYDNFNIPLITTDTLYKSIKFVMKDRHTILSRYGLIKNGVLYALAIPMVKEEEPEEYAPYGYERLPWSYPAWGTLYDLWYTVLYPPYLSYQTNFVDNSVLLFSDNLTAFYVNGEVFTNPFSTNMEISYYSENPTAENLYTNLYPQHFVETDNTQYWSFDQNLYIENRRYTEDFKPLLYFPEINTEIRANKITNLLVIDRGIVALFNEYEVWYVSKVTLEDSKIAYAYYKSRIGLGCKEGADIDILYDGATITYGTPRGIVGMNYQQLTQNTDQILNFLSDNISTNYFAWYGNGEIKIFKYKFWVVFYKQNTYQCLVLDLRNGSWWYWNSKVEGGLKSIYLYEDKPLLLDVNGQLMVLDQGYTGVYGDLDIKVIDWKATSQPLSFGAINNYKQIKGININNVQLTKDPFNYILICRNYKNQKNLYLPKIVDFEQEKITVGSYRTFVKRLNYIQSVKFQYTIANNSDLPVQTPVSISAISTKYEIKGRVR